MGDNLSFLPQSDFLLEVSKGNVAGHSTIYVYGSIDAVQAATPADIWEFGTEVGAEIYTFSSTDDIDTISSSSASDTLTMTIEGLDASGNAVTQEATLNGQNKVALTTPLWRVNAVDNTSSTNLVGNVYVYVDGAITAGVPNTVTDVRGFVSPAAQRSKQAVYTVPNGVTAHFYGSDQTITKGVAGGLVTINLKGFIRIVGGVFREIFETLLASTGSSHHPLPSPPPISLAGKTDLRPNAEVSTNGVGVSWGYYLVLVED